MVSTFFAAPLSLHWSRVTRRTGAGSRRARIRQPPAAPPAPAPLRSPLAECPSLGQVEAAPRSPAVHTRLCGAGAGVGFFSPKGLLPVRVNGTRHSDLLGRHSMLLSAATPHSTQSSDLQPDNEDPQFSVECSGNPAIPIQIAKAVSRGEPFNPLMYFLLASHPSPSRPA